METCRKTNMRGKFTKKNKKNYLKENIFLVEILGR